MENGNNRRRRQFQEVAVSETVGREECVNNLLLKLIPKDRHGNDGDLRVISVVNGVAMGKTALARCVYDRLDVKRWFTYRAWVHVQDNFSVGDVLVNILRQISTREMKNIDLADEDGLSFRLHEYFIEQRYLVVLDNINSDDLIVKLLAFFIDLTNGSRVIITTRKNNLPDLVDPLIEPITFRPLTGEDRKQLLLRCSNENEPDGQVHPARLHLMQRILSWCSLSPAGILLLGGLLSVTRERGQFESAIGRLAENPSLMDVVSLCYDQLSPSLQSCIMYVCKFPREYEIPTRRLLRLWLAENLVPVSHRGIQDAEDYFQELVHRSMIHVVSRGKGHGFAKSCRMPGFIYDFLHQKVLETRKDSGLFEACSNDSSTNTPNGKPKFVARWFAVDQPESLGGSSEKQEESDRRRYKDKQLRSYISFNTKKNRKQKRDLDIFHNPKGEKSSLEVLDLEGVYKPVLPKNLGKVLLNLKYLGLRWTIIDKLPKSVGDLPCLETLDVKHTNITKISSSIWTKKSLCHLYLNEMSFDESIPYRWWLSPFSGKLPNKLQTLCGLHIKDKSRMLDVLSKLTGVTKLSLTCPATVVKEVMERIKGLTTLQSLKLKSKDLLGQPSKVHPKDISALISLSNLYLFGDLRGSSLSFLPKNLKSLTLSMSFLATHAMDVLAMLEFLTDLRLHAFSFDGTTLKCAKGMFAHLRVLKLWKLANLESLVVEDEAMPRLEELDIRDCPKLGEIQVLGDRKELKEIGLAKVKEELARSLEASLGRSVIITTELIASATATAAEFDQIEHNGMVGTRGDDDDDDTREVKTSSRRERGKTRTNPSLTASAIARTASKPTDVFSMDAKELIPGLYKGVFLNGNKTKFWIDEKLHKNCLMVLAKGLSISWSDDQNYWKWIPCQEDCFGGPVEVRVPELVYVYWLDISAKIPSTMLSPMTTYEVVFVLMMKASFANEWHFPVNFSLILPNGTKQNRTEILEKKPTEQWIEITLGEFVTTPEIIGYIHFSVIEHSTAFAKKGFVVKGFIFRPKC